MIDPIHSLTLSIHAKPGVYALLLGSGVSRAAKIPTGWEITLDLIRKLASRNGESCEPHPERWYRFKYMRDPDYSELLDALKMTPSERQQLLRQYVEPTEQEFGAGEKCPTAAHHAIANLVKQGFVRVIITTNFDRLIEIALQDAGVPPTVLKTPDDIANASPLAHIDRCVFKVHGDYLDPRFKNTPDELNQYEPEIDRFLDRVFADFGLIVCGWSAEWDGALRKAILRAPMDRFSTYWTTIEKLGEQAQRLVNHCQAKVISIEGADRFFQSIQERVESLQSDAPPRSLSVERSVAKLEEFIVDPKHRIKLQKLVSRVVEQTIEVISSEAFFVHDNLQWTTKAVTDRVRRYEEACLTLLAMATTAGYWAEEEHYPVWCSAMKRIGEVRAQSGPIDWIDLQYYPSTLLLYALGLGAAKSGRLRFLNSLFSTELPHPWKYFNGAPKVGKAVNTLPPFCMFRNSSKRMRVLDGMENNHAPLNERLRQLLRQHSSSIIPDPSQYTLAFVELEILIALGGLVEDGLFTPGTFCYEREARNSILEKIKGSLDQMGDGSHYVMCGIFGNSAAECFQTMVVFMNRVSNTRWSLL